MSNCPERPGIFVDRDGTICYDKHYLSDPNGLEFLPTVVEGLRILTRMNLPIIIITNQSGIARGFFSTERLEEIHERLLSMLSDQGVKITDVFYCPHLPGSGCNCRKPATGLIEEAARKHRIDLSKSAVVGDRMMDIEMAHSVRARGILVPEIGDQYKIDDEIAASREVPDFRARTFIEAIEWLVETMNLTPLRQE